MYSLRSSTIDNRNKSINYSFIVNQKMIQKPLKQIKAYKIQLVNITLPYRVFCSLPNCSVLECVNIAHPPFEV